MRPPTDQNFFNFMGFFRKCINILGRRPPKGLAPPPTTSPGSAPAVCISYLKKCKLTIELFSLWEEHSISEH